MRTTLSLSEIQSMITHLVKNGYEDYAFDGSIKDTHFRLSPSSAYTFLQIPFIQVRGVVTEQSDSCEIQLRFSMNAMVQIVLFLVLSFYAGLYFILKVIDFKLFKEVNNLVFIVIPVIGFILCQLLFLKRYYECKQILQSIFQR